VTEQTLTLVVFIFIVPIWSVAMWAMTMMAVGALRDERFTLFRFFTGYFVQEPYNRKYRLVFTGCVAAGVGLGVVFNVLFLLDVIKP